MLITIGLCAKKDTALQMCKEKAGEMKLAKYLSIYNFYLPKTYKNVLIKYIIYIKY